MEKKQYKILLNALENAGSEAQDVFLQLDLNQTFSTISKEKYDNNFDLARQFERERDSSRSFRVYGEVASTVIDCDNVTIRVFSDAEHLTEIATLQTTKVSYDRKNVFGKKKGKYLLELDNYLFDEVYMLIESDNFSYKDQKWAQRLVHYDADGVFVPYGNETADISIEGEIITIENNYPFFFNKHWVRLDYNIIEEKIAKYTWNIPTSLIAEGQSVPLELRLDKPSPFGNEQLTLNWSENTSSDRYQKGVLSGLASDNPQRIFEVNVPEDQEDQTLAVYNGNFYVIIPTTDDSVDLFGAGQNIRFLDGDYQGEYTILASTTIDLLIPDLEFELTAIVLDSPYFTIPSNSNTSRYFAGSFPDVRILEDGEEVQLPLDLTWNTNEEIKDFTIQGLEDFEIEFDEFFQIEGTNEVRIDKGPFPIHSLTLENSTVARQVQYNLQDLYENRLSFTGRTAYDTDIDAFDDQFLSGDGLIEGTGVHYIEGPAVLRNGLMWEGRNEEFYPNDFFNLTIINEGIKTVVPANPDLGIEEPQLLRPQEELTVRVNSKYDQSNLNSIKATWTLSDSQIFSEIIGGTSDDPKFTINGCDVIGDTTLSSASGKFSYSVFKVQLEEANDVYASNSVERPFTVTFNDDERTAIFTSLNPGVKLDIGTLNPYVELEELTPFFIGSQITKSILLNANTNENQETRYRIQISKPGFKTLEIPPQSIPAAVGVINNVYMVSGYENVFYPYDSNLGQCFFANNANNVPGVNSIEALNDQPGYMERGNVFINGGLLLSAGLWPLSVGNLTESVITNEDTEQTIFGGAFLPNPIGVLPCTEELISTTGTYGIWRIFIKDMSSADLEDIAGDLEGTRAFDINFGTGDGAFSWTVGGTRPIGPYVLEQGAPQWWEGTYIPVSSEGTPMANSILRVRLDDGGTAFDDTEVPEGPLEGTVVNNSTLELRGKTQGLDFSISNLQNFDGFNEGESTGFLESILDFLEDTAEDIGLIDETEDPDINPYALKAVRVAPSLNPGDINTGRNGLSGFALEIE